MSFTEDESEDPEAKAERRFCLSETGRGQGESHATNAEARRRRRSLAEQGQRSVTARTAR